MASDPRDETDRKRELTEDDMRRIRQWADEQLRAILAKKKPAPPKDGEDA